MRERRTTTADIKKEHACLYDNWKCQVYSLLLLLCIMKLIEFFSFLLSILLFLFFRSIARAHTNQPTNKQKKEVLPWYILMNHFYVFFAADDAFHYLSSWKTTDVEQRESKGKTQIPFFLQRAEWWWWLTSYYPKKYKKESIWELVENGGEMNDIIISSLTPFSSSCSNFIIRHA